MFNFKITRNQRLATLVFDETVAEKARQDRTTSDSNLVNVTLESIDACQCHTDCNSNGLPDDCDLLDPNFDQNLNGEIDECECLADLNDDCVVGVDDILVLIGFWGTSNPAVDFDFNGIVDVEDLLFLIVNLGQCCSNWGTTCGPGSPIPPCVPPGLMGDLPRCPPCVPDDDPPLW